MAKKTKRSSSKRTRRKSSSPNASDGLLKTMIKEVGSMLIGKVERTLEEIKRRVLQTTFTFILFFLAIVLILVGFVKYLAEISVFSSEAMSFMGVGVVLLLIALIYKALTQ